MRRAVLAIILVVAVAAAFAPCVFAQAKKPADVITLKGKTQAPVAFTHAVHAKAYKCAECHATATGGALKSADAKPNAYHAAMFKGGLCADCHTKLKAEGNTKVPTKCTECHKKAA